MRIIDLNVPTVLEVVEHEDGLLVSRQDVGVLKSVRHPAAIPGDLLVADGPPRRVVAERERLFLIHLGG